jgi:hypothetical protein
MKNTREALGMSWTRSVYFCYSLAVAVALHQVVYDMNKMKRLLFPDFILFPSRLKLSRR